MGLLLLLAAAARAETGGACSVEAPSVVADRLRDLLASGRNQEAVRAVGELEAKLACLDAFTSAADLANVYQLAGTAAYYVPELEASAALYRRAVVVASNVPFDGANLGSDAARAYEEARREVASGPVGGLVALGPVVVDGTAVRAGSSIVLPVGAHLVQEGLDGRVRSTVVALVQDQTVRVGTPDPALLEAKRALHKRRRGAAFVTSGALALLGGGLYALAVAQESAALDVDPESFPTDAAARERASFAQLGTNAALGGAVLALSGSVAFAWHGATLQVQLYPLADLGDAGAPTSSR